MSRTALAIMVVIVLVLCLIGWGACYFVGFLDQVVIPDQEDRW